MKSHIDVYCRVKPYKKYLSSFNLTFSQNTMMPYRLDNNNNILNVQIPKNIKSGHVNNTKVFLFNPIHYPGIHGVPFYESLRFSSEPGGFIWKCCKACRFEVLKTRLYTYLEAVSRVIMGLFSHMDKLAAEKRILWVEQVRYKMIQAINF